MATGSKKRKLAPKASPTRKPADHSDPKLALMLARQTITRWQFAAGQLRARSSAPAAQTRRIEIELGLGQLQAVAERLRPLLKSRDMARRFESEELLVQIDGLSADLVALQAENPAPAEVPRPRTAAEIEERFRAALALKAAE